MYWCTTDIKYSIEYYPVNFMSKWEAGANSKWDLISGLLFKWWDFWMSYFKLFIFKTFGPLPVWGSWLLGFQLFQIWLKNIPIFMDHLQYLLHNLQCGLIWMVGIVDCHFTGLVWIVGMVDCHFTNNLNGNIIFDASIIIVDNLEV